MWTSEASYSPSTVVTAVDEPVTAQPKRCDALNGLVFSEDITASSSSALHVHMVLRVYKGGCYLHLMVELHLSPMCGYLGRAEKQPVMAAFNHCIVLSLHMPA